MRPKSKKQEMIRIMLPPRCLLPILKMKLNLMYPPEAEDRPIASSSVVSPPQTAILPIDNFDVATSTNNSNHFGSDRVKDGTVDHTMMQLNFVIPSGVRLYVHTRPCVRMVLGVLPWVADTN